VRGLIGNEFIKRLGKTFNSYLVGHGARRAKQSRLHAKHSGSFGFKRIYGFVLTKNIISYFGAPHSFEHAWGWPGYSIAS
jgi:hypothetical protein